MRRTAAAFPWVSMMDLLFGLFGGLVILTTIISFKLGTSTGIDDRPFGLMTVAVTSTDATVVEALHEMRIGFELTGDGVPCRMGPPFADDACGAGRRVAIGRTNHGLMSTLLLEPEGVPSKIAVRPILTELGFFDDMKSETEGNSSITITLRLKSGDVVWEPAPVLLAIDKNRDRAGDRSEVAILGLVPCTPAAGCNKEMVDDATKAHYFSSQGR